MAISDDDFMSSAEFDGSVCYEEEAEKPDTSGLISLWSCENDDCCVDNLTIRCGYSASGDMKCPSCQSKLSFMHWLKTCRLSPAQKGEGGVVMRRRK